MSDIAIPGRTPSLWGEAIGVEVGSPMPYMYVVVERESFQPVTQLMVAALRVQYWDSHCDSVIENAIEVCITTSGQWAVES